MKTTIPLLLILTAAATASAAWSPAKRPDAAPATWQAGGCRTGVIDYQYFGAVEGHICTWRRSSREGPLVRRELYTMRGEFASASETLAGADEAFDVIFFNRGRSYFRLSPHGQQLVHVIAVVVGGREVARYASSWDRFAVTPDGDLIGVPMDTRLVSGAPYAPIEQHSRRADELDVESLRQDGVDVSRSVGIEFGFWFPTANDAAKTALLALGCRWLTSEERNGTIGPFPDHCLKHIDLSPANLAAWHTRFTKVAQVHGGRYYGWHYRFRE